MTRTAMDVDLDVPARLAQYRALVQPTIAAALPAREPRRHLYDPIAAYLKRVGKGVRPALCLATCRAFGGDAHKALPSAAALEILHNAFLVHDDIEDGSEFRRDQPTMQREYGLALAVNTGDALQALGIRVLRANLSRLGPVASARIFDEFDHLLIQSLEGQAMELGWIRDNDCTVSEDDYLLMILKKTCWYSFIQPCRIGALVAGQTGPALDRFNRFGYFVGAAFQIQDDVLNLIGDAKVYGKEIAGDLWEGKRTLILAHLFQAADASESQRLRAIFAHPREGRTQADIDWIYSRLEHHGSIEYARTAARQLVQASAHEFQRAYAGAREGEDKAFVRALVEYMIQRQV
jgi:geranylgeranyl diphosphate synthase, type II